MNREERLHRLEAAYYVARRAYIDADRDFYAAACAYYELASMKLDGEID